jgi:hypothetical protein
MSEEKIRVIREWPAPKKLKELRSFIGFINFNRQFIQNFSKKALPLTRLTKKEIPWKWKEPQQQAFMEPKEACCTPPVLVAFRNGEPLRLEAGVSDLVLGATALQERDTHWHPIAQWKSAVAHMRKILCPC